MLCVCVFLRALVGMSDLELVLTMKVYSNRSLISVCVRVLSLYSYRGVLGLLRNAGLKGHGPYIQNALHHDTHSFSCGEFKIVAPCRDKMSSIPQISTSQQHSFYSVLSFAAFICFSSKRIICFKNYSACNV